MTERTRTRRFIAGAVCPGCRAMDRIVLETAAPEHGTGDAVRRRYCVSCGYTDTLTAASSTEPATRLSRPGKREAPATSVRIVDPRERRH